MTLLKALMHHSVHSALKSFWYIYSHKYACLLWSAALYWPRPRAFWLLCFLDETPILEQHLPGGGWAALAWLQWGLQLHQWSLGFFSIKNKWDAHITGVIHKPIFHVTHSCTYTCCSMLYPVTRCLRCLGTPAQTMYGHTAGWVS